MTLLFLFSGDEAPNWHEDMAIDKDTDSESFPSTSDAKVRFRPVLHLFMRTENWTKGSVQRISELWTGLSVQSKKSSVLGS